MYGSYGAGKTTFVHSVLSQVVKSYGYIDCVLHTNELEIAKFLYQTLHERWKFHDPDVKTGSFLDIKKYLAKRTVGKQPIYFVFDNITRIFGRKLFKKVMALKSALKNRLKLVLICDGFIPKTKFCDELFLLEEGFVGVLMPSPSKEHLESVLVNKLPWTSRRDIFSLFVDLIYQQYGQYTADIHYFLYLCNILLPVFLKGVDLNNLKEDEIPKLYSEEFRRVGKALITNLYMPLSCMEELNANASKYDETKEVSLLSKVEDTQLYGQNTKHGLTYLEGVILVAAYIACHNPEQTDQKIFVKQKA